MSPPPDPGWRERVAVLGALAALGFAVYARSLGGEFLNWDDPTYVVDNPELRDPSAAAAGRILTTFHFANYNPLHRLSYLLDASLFGLDPVAFRVHNLVLHVGCAFALYLVARAWGAGLAASALAAAVFAAHPANVEVVAWISQRKALLSTAFGLLAVYAWLRAERRGSAARFTALGLFALGLLGKTSIVALPAILPVLDLSRRQPLRWRWYAAFCVPALGAAVVQLAATSASGAVRAPHGGGLVSHAATVVASIPAYVQQLAGLTAGYSPRHVFEPVASAGDPRLWLGAAILVALCAAAWRSWSRSRKVALALAWFALALLPTLAVPIPIVVADRYLYFAMPVAVAVAVEAACRLRFPAWTSRAALLAATGILACIASSYAAVWRDSVALWEHASTRAPGDKQAWASLGAAHAARCATDSARHAFERALAVDPQYHGVAENLAVLELEAGNHARARALLAAVVERQPQRAGAWARLGAVLDLEGQREAAARAFEFGLRYSPAAVELWLGLARFRSRNGDRAGAIEALRAALQHAPRHPRASRMLAELCAPAPR